MKDSRQLDGGTAKKFRHRVPQWREKLGVIVCLLLLPFVAGAQSKTVTLQVKEMGVEEIILELRQTSGYRFLFNHEEVKDLGAKSIDMQNAPIEDVMEAVLEGTGMTFRIENDVIVIQPKQPTGTVEEVRVQGQVRDEQGQPLPGVTVVLKGTTIGGATDIDGNFSFDVPGNNDITLVFSFVGMETQEIQYTGEKLNITLSQELNEMDEVVVTGYQTIRKERMTGSTTTITANQIAGRGLQSIDEILNSTVSGLNMISSGRPGQDAQIQIRGVNSLTGSTEPMWIVDGMPLQGEIPNIQSGSTDIQSTIFTTGIGNIAPDDIKSITVLKDAAATAIYGARAANGVIVVETKSGLVGKTRFNASVNLGITERPRNNVEMMNTAEKIQFEQEIYEENFIYSTTPGRITRLLQQVDYGVISENEAQTEINRLRNIETDWFKEIYHTALSQQYNFSMSGGTEQTQHYASINYLREKGIEPNNRYDRLGMNIKLTHNPSKKIRITGGLSATMRNDRITASIVNSLEYAMYANPYEQPYNSDGSLAYDITWDPTRSTLRDGLAWDKFNILDDLNRNTNTSRYLDAELSLKVEWEIIKGLMYSIHGVYNANSNHNRVIEGEGTYTNFKNNWMNGTNGSGDIAHELVKGSLNESTGYSNAYTIRNTLQYSTELKGKHFITLFAGQEISSRISYNSYNYSPVFDEEHRIIGFPQMNGIDGGAIKFSSLGGTGREESKMSSFFANASYSYMDRYIVTGAVRYDGSDIIGNDNQFTPLWNVGARWNLHKEQFIETLPWINLLSLRAGFGYTGSIDKNALPFVIMNLGQSVIYDGQSVPTSFDYPNPNVKWQTKQDMNIGLDFSILDYKFEVGVNYYYNITRDVLDRMSLPYSSGRNEVTKNVADIYNNGWEVDLGLTLLKRKHFQWFGKLNLAFNNNKVKKTFYKKEGDLPIATLENANQYVENYPVNAWFGYKFAGVDPINGYALTYTGNDGATLNMDVSGEEWPEATVFYLGKQDPPLIGGFSTSINWKQFIFSTNFEFKAGHLIKSFTTFRALDATNRHVSDLYRWRQAGDVTNIPQLSEGWRAASNYMYDCLLEKGDYLRCSYLTIGYNIKPEILSKIGFSTARISFTAKDLFTLSNYKGIDPVLMGSFGYPNTRKYTITLNVGF